MQKLVEIGRFDNPVEAHFLLDLLTDAGIPARIFDEHTGSALPHFGMIGVRVVVRAEDAERATGVIAEEKAQRASPSPQDLAQMDGQGSGLDDGDARLPIEDDGLEEDRAGDATPTTGQPSEAPDREEPELVAWALRTRTFAFVGLGLLPFAFGAIFRATRPPPGIESSERATSLVRQARWIAYLAIVSFLGLCYLLFSGRH